MHFLLFLNIINYKILYQTKKMINLKNVQKIAKDIKDITIQWATNIAREACKIMEQELRNQQFTNLTEVWEFYNKASKMLIDARETEPLLRNAMKYAKSKLEWWADSNKIADAFSEYLWWIEREEKIRPEIWSDLIHDWDIIFTHCHSKSVIDILVKARNNWKKIQVYNTETRPLYQWRKTSQDLINAWIPDTMVVDSSASSIIDNTVWNTVDIKEIFLWSDCIKPDWTVINKIWSFSIWLSAWNSWIPLYIVWSLLKIDVIDKIWIETRSWEELRPEAPEWLNIVNFAFDRIPHKCITWIVTEFGVIRPENLMREIQKHYPRMLED